MTSGRQDYWYAMLPGHSILMSGQREWQVIGNWELEDGLAHIIIDYTVPAGYILNIISGVISCSDPGIQRLEIRINLGTNLRIYWDLSYNFPFTVAGSYVLTAGERFQVKVINNFGYLVLYEAGFFGFEEHKIG